MGAISPSKKKSRYFPFRGHILLLIWPPNGPHSPSASLSEISAKRKWKVHCTHRSHNISINLLTSLYIHTLFPHWLNGCKPDWRVASEARRVLSETDSLKASKDLGVLSIFYTITKHQWTEISCIETTHCKVIQQLAHVWRWRRHHWLTRTPQSALPIPAPLCDTLDLNLFLKLSRCRKKIIYQHLKQVIFFKV